MKFQFLIVGLFIPLMTSADPTSTTSPATNSAALSTNQFGFDLYKILADKNGSLVFSPFSIETAMAMTAGGAQNETLSQMNQVLHFTKNIHTDEKSLLEGLKKSLIVSNKLWAAKSSDYNPTFTSLLKDNYSSKFETVDFKSQPEMARKKINDDVALETHDKIKNLLAPGSVTHLTQLILTNVIYFKAKWMKVFQKSLTAESDFWTSATEKKTVQMMHLKSQFFLVENEDLQMLELPYDDGRLAMDVILPRDKSKSFALDLSRLQKLFVNMPYVSVQVSLPKFKLESSLNLVESLKLLGLYLPFDPEKSDFSKMRAIEENGEKLSISGVIHKAFVEVDEDGTEAAAATAVVMDGHSIIHQAAPPKIFKADHSFLFLIRDLQTQAILFMGRE